jgi:hypothetical protein
MIGGAPIDLIEVVLDGCAVLVVIHEATFDADRAFVAFEDSHYHLSRSPHSVGTRVGDVSLNRARAITRI